MTYEHELNTDKASVFPKDELSDLSLRIIELGKRPYSQRVLDQIDSGDSMGLYLADINTYPLLTKDEERILAHTLDEGRKFKSMKRSLDTIYFTNEKAKSAYQTLINCNLRLVVSIAKPLQGQGLELQDLIDEGNIGLMEGVSRFDPNRGRLSTYATYWIRQSIFKAIGEKGRTIQQPFFHLREYHHLHKTEEHLIQELGRTPTSEELAEGMGVTAEKIDDMKTHDQHPDSLDREKDIHGKMISLAETIPSQISVPGDAESSIFGKRTREALSCLPIRLRMTLQLRYGLFDGETYSFRDIAALFGVSSARIEQLEESAKKRLIITLNDLREAVEPDKLIELDTT